MCAQQDYEQLINQPWFKKNELYHSLFQVRMHAFAVAHDHTWGATCAPQIRDLMDKLPSSSSVAITSAQACMHAVLVRADSWRRDSTSRESFSRTREWAR